MYNLMILALSGLSILTLILGSLLWGYERAQHTDAQERAENLEAARRIEAGRILNENSHGDGWEYRD
jgi:nitrogen fixation-related uncharacterized protein